MKRLILIIISSFTVLFTSAQGEIIFDSIPNNRSEIKELSSAIEKPMLLNETSFSDGSNLFEKFQLNQPPFPDYNKNLDFGKYLASRNRTSYYFNNTGSSFNIFFPVGHIYNQSNYQINKLFLIGGNSFGANSVFDLPKLNSTIQEMSVKGASIFLQYKVSDNFKIETRISISNHPSSPLFP